MPHFAFVTETFGLAHVFLEPLPNRAGFGRGFVSCQVVRYRLAYSMAAAMPRGWWRTLPVGVVMLSE